MRLKSFLRVCDSISLWSGKIFIWLILPLTAIVAYEVLSRRVFDAPHIWAPEVTDYIYGPHFMLVAAYTLLYRAHVSIDIIYQRFSARVRGILDIITYSVFYFPFCVVMFIEGIRFAHTSWVRHETSGSAALPVVPEIKTVIPITFALLLIQGVANYIRAIYLVGKGQEI